MTETYINYEETDQEIVLSFTEFVNERMKKLGITQNFIAAETGMRQGHISEILNGLKRPSVVTAHRILNAINAEIIFKAKR